VEYLGVKEAARLESVSPKTLLRRLERNRIILANDPEDGRRKLIPVSALSKSAYQAWMNARVAPGIHSSAMMAMRGCGKNS